MQLELSKLKIQNRNGDYLVTRMTHLKTDDNHCMVAKITRDTFGPRR